MFKKHKRLKLNPLYLQSKTIRCFRKIWFFFSWNRRLNNSFNCLTDRKEIFTHAYFLSDLLPRKIVKFIRSKSCALWEIILFPGSNSLSQHLCPVNQSSYYSPHTRCSTPRSRNVVATINTIANSVLRPSLDPWTQKLEPPPPAESAELTKDLFKALE